MQDSEMQIRELEDTLSQRIVQIVTDAVESTLIQVKDEIILEFLKLVRRKS